jgi:glycerophosphoryl diester phosphodiesterase
MRADTFAPACAVREFGHGVLLLPRGAAAAAPALIYQSPGWRVAIPRRPDVHDSVRAGGDNRPATLELAHLHQSWLTRTPIAHRGLHAAHAGRPENSLAAFEHACALRFPVELDVRLTRDREVVVFHDRWLRRLTGTAGRVEDSDAADIRALRLLGTVERVPLLREVLDVVDGRVPLLVELKSSLLWPALERAVIEALDGYAGDIAIQSFKRRTVRALDRSDAPHAVGHLWPRLGVPATGVRAGFHGCHVDALPSRAVRRRREAGAVVLAWTVRSESEAARAMRYVDNYIFEGFVPATGRGHPLNTPGSEAVASP